MPVAALGEIATRLSKVASDSARTPSSRIAELRRLADEISASQEALLGQVAGYIGSLQLQQEGGSTQRQNELLLARENADIREALLASGTATPEELDAAGYLSHDAIDEGVSDGTLEESFLGKIDPELLRKLALKRRRDHGRFADEFSSLAGPKPVVAKGRGGAKLDVPTVPKPKVPFDGSGRGFFHPDEHVIPEPPKGHIVDAPKTATPEQADALKRLHVFDKQAIAQATSGPHHVEGLERVAREHGHVGLADKLKDVHKHYYDPHYASDRPVRNRDGAMDAVRHASTEFGLKPPTPFAGKESKGTYHEEPQFPTERLTTKKSTARGASQETAIDVGGDVQKAAELLAKGHHVKLDQPSRVSTLLDHLADIANQAKAAGKDAPNYDLCKVSVPGTNLFCAETKGYDRIEMPQLSGIPEPGTKAAELPANDKGEVDLAPLFRQYLEFHGVKINDTTRPAANLRASQRELNGAKVAGIAGWMRTPSFPGNPRLFTSSDDYIVDGHHRWAATVGNDAEDGKLGDDNMDVAQVDMPITDLLDEANAFAAEMGIAPKSAKGPADALKGGEPDKPDAPAEPTPAAPASPGTAPPDVTTMKRADLTNEWAQLDKELLDYAGDPNHPESRRITDRQREVVTEIHHRNKSLTQEDLGGVQAHDVVVVGFGPAGMSSSIYAASEGLDTVALEASDKPGGQASMSSRIENLASAPAGITGTQYAQQGHDTATRLGADVRFGSKVTNVEHDPDTGLKTLTLADGSQVRARSVVIAGGVQFRKLPNIPDYDGVVYGNSGEIKRQMNEGETAVIVGGANSAGQAAVDILNSGRKVKIAVRGDSIHDKMSQYLVDQLEADPNAEILTNTEIGEVHADEGGHVSGITTKNGEKIDATAIGLFVGQAAQSDWTGDVEIHGEGPHRGKVKVGEEDRGQFETNVPGVFAVGDVKAKDQTKNHNGRVIMAAGEGGAVISDVHDYKAQMMRRWQAAQTAGQEGIQESAAEKFGEYAPDDGVDPATIDRTPDEADGWYDAMGEFDRENPWAFDFDTDPGYFEGAPDDNKEPQ